MKMVFSYGLRPRLWLLSKQNSEQVYAAGAKDGKTRVHEVMVDLVLLLIGCKGKMFSLIGWNTLNGFFWASRRASQLGAKKITS